MHATKRYGIPFKRCRFCGKDFVDKDVTELATKPLEYYQKRLERNRVCNILVWVLIACLIVCPSLVRVKVDKQVTSWLFILLIVVIAVLILIRDANNDGMGAEELDAEYKKSKLRLEKHPQYAAEVRALEDKKR